GMVPAEGWTGDAEWAGEVPFEEMPHALNPADGYLVNCNQRIVDESYPYFLGNAWINGYRARRARDVIAGNVPFSQADCRALQMDLVTPASGELVRRLRDLDPVEPDLRDALARLRAWDGNLTADSVAGAIYEVLRMTLARNVLEPGLGQALALRWMGQGFHPVLRATSELHGHEYLAVLRLLDAPDSWWVQQAGGREAWIRRSLQQTVDWLREAMGSDPSRWTWGRIHRTSLPHALGARPPLDAVFDRGPFAVGGDSDTPNQSALRPERPYDNRGIAATFREIIDLGDLSRSQVIVPPGQSGRLGSRHYDDLISPWLIGEYVPMLWTREQVEAHLEARLELVAP
ncbi:MAG: penicillin acylase family protein, partial [Anaerolineae bacterium]